MDAYEAVIRRAGAQQLGVLGAGPEYYYQQVQGGGDGGNGSAMMYKPAMVVATGKGPAEVFTTVVKPAACACPQGMNPDGTRVPQCGWPDERTSRLRGKALNDARAKAVEDFKKACAEWKTAHCFDPAILEIKRRVQQQQSSVWPLAAPAAQSFMPLYPVRTSPVVQTANVGAARFTASGFQMQVTPMDFTTWMQAQAGKARVG
jgi:hypothetical protein